jgi:peroxiredoxin
LDLNIGNREEKIEHGEQLVKLTTLTGTLKQMLKQSVTGKKGNILEEGTKAPEFEIYDESGKKHTLNQYKGRKVVLWFFPRASTPG